VSRIGVVSRDSEIEDYLELDYDAGHETLHAQGLKSLREN
jgi:hypothetical protein